MNIKEKKIANTILFFANKSKNNTINYLKLIKLIWVSDRLHLNKYGRLIINDRYNALPHGPVASETYEMIKSGVENKFSKSKYNVVAEDIADEEYFSNSDIEVMDYVWSRFGGVNKYELRDLSHDFPEWKRFEEDINDKYSPNCYDMVIQDFFEEPENHTFSDFISDEQKELSRHEFNVHSSIKRALRV